MTIAIIGAGNVGSTLGKGSARIRIRATAPRRLT